MHDLIKIENTTIGSETVPTVNARELHEFLEVKTKFATWVSNRIDKYEFVENTDFTTISKNLENGGRLVEYHISLDMAKELSMVENNDKGRQARRYFIECEKQFQTRTLPQTYSQVLREVHQRRSVASSGLSSLERYIIKYNGQTIETLPVSEISPAEIKRQVIAFRYAQAQSA